jgi:hypothetical protein
MLVQKREALEQVRVQARAQGWTEERAGLECWLNHEIALLRLEVRDAG